MSQNESKSPSVFTRDFTLVVMGQIISLFGNAILRFALPLYVLYQSDSEALFGLVSASAFIPMVILSPIGGIIADRVNKQRIMVALDFFTCALVFGFMLLTGQVALVPLVIIMLMMLYAIQGVYTPAVQASLPILAGGDGLVTANAVVNLVNSLSSLLGPVIGGMLYGRFGLTPIVVVGGVSFFLSAVMELFIRIPHTKQKAASSVWSLVRDDLTVSVRFMLREQPTLVKGTAIVFGVNLFMSAMIMIGMPVLITRTLGLSSELYGLAQGVLAAGGLAGGVLAGVLGRKLDIRRAWTFLLACGAGLFPIGLVFLLGAPAMVSYVVLTGINFVLMACASLFSIQMLAFVQSETPPELVGKVISVVMAACTCAQPIGQAMYGVLFQVLAGSPWMILMGGAVVTSLLALYSRSTFAQLRGKAEPAGA